MELYGYGLYSLPLRDFTECLRVVWHQTHPMRAGLHRLVGIGWCDTGLSGPGLRLGAGTAGQLPMATASGRQRWLRLTGNCPCRDYLADILTEANRYLTKHRGQVRNPAGAVREHLRTRGTDWTRQRRAAMGAQTRTDRIAQSRHGRQLTSEFDRALLRRVVEEAGSAAPLDDHNQLVHRLADLMAADFGGTRADHLNRVVTGLQVVEAQCRTGPRVNVGTTAQPEFVTWWEAYVQRPLGRRPRRTDQQIGTGPDGIGGEFAAPGVELVCRAAERELERVTDAVAVADLLGPTGRADSDALVVAVLVSRLAQPHLDPEGVIRTTVRELSVREFITPATADAFLADDSRVRTAFALLVTIRDTATPADPSVPFVSPARTTGRERRTAGNPSAGPTPETK